MHIDWWTKDAPDLQFRRRGGTTDVYDTLMPDIALLLAPRVRPGVQPLQCSQCPSRDVLCHTGGKHYMYTYHNQILCLRCAEQVQRNLNVLRRSIGDS